MTNHAEALSTQKMQPQSVFHVEAYSYHTREGEQRFGTQLQVQQVDHNSNQRIIL